MRRHELPAEASSFGKVVVTLKEQGRVPGWELARDTLLLQYDTLKQQIAPATILKLAMEMDRHALFAAVAQQKDTTEKDEQIRKFQDYLQGKIEIDALVDTPTPATAEADGIRLSVEDAGGDDADDEEEDA